VHRTTAQPHNRTTAQPHNHTTTQPHNRTTILFLILLSIFLSSNLEAKAKKKGFEYTTTPKTYDLDGKKVMKYVYERHSVKKAHYIKFDGKIDEDGVINFTLPDNPKNELRMDVVYTDFKTENSYSIHGSSDDGEITIYTSDDGYMGSLRYKDREFSFFPIKKKTSILIERDVVEEARNQPSMKCGNDEKRTSTKKISNRVPIQCFGDCGGQFLDVLTIVTPPAATWLNNNLGVWQNLWLQAALDNINTALIMSGVNNKSVRNRFIFQTSPFLLSNNINQDIINMRNNPTIIALRDNARADVVNMLTLQNYIQIENNQIFQVFGVASNVDPMAIDQYTICEIPFIDESRFTFAHEVAHLMGCEHAINHSPMATCNRGHRFTAGGVLRASILGDQVQNFVRINNYSNPNINFMGVPTGEANRNNAGVIQNHFCSVGSINTPSEFAPDISGYQCSGANNTYTAINLIPNNNLGVITCIAPYTFQWSWSNSSGGPWINFGANSISATLSAQPCFAKYIRLIVTSSDGCTYTRTKFYKCTQCLTKDISAETRSIIKEETINVYPNPSNQIFEIETDADVKNYRVFGTDGKLILEKHNVDNKFFSIDLNTQSNNIYILHLELNSGEKIIRKLILHHD
jgi:hypothetical protein